MNHFYPHPSELADWTERFQRPVPDRHRHYHWGHLNTGLPWIEDRLYRDGPNVYWDDITHGRVRPHGLQREAPFHPIFRHFKVIATDTRWCEVIGGSTYYRHHWQGLEHRTGVPFQVQQFEDLFVASVPKYAVCDRFDGVFDQPWNMGEEFRPDSDRQRELFPAAGHIESPPTRAKSEAPAPVASTRPVGGSSTLTRPDRPLRVALGPENPAFGSWNWLGAELAQELAADHDVTVYREIIPEADVVVFFKFLHDCETLRAVHQRSAVIYCPVDVYGSAAEIDGDALRLRLCDRIVVHCRRLMPYFQSYVPTSYLDHHVKYVITDRSDPVTDGPVLWVGEKSNLAPVVEWVNGHDLPAQLVVLTNVPPATTAESLRFDRRHAVGIESWSADSHLAWLSRCRCAFDIKSDDFRARHKSPAKALDYLASGVPFAMNHPSSSVDHLRELGFEIPEPEDFDRWLSPEYAAECQQFGQAIRELLSLNRLGHRWRKFIGEVAALR